MMKIFGKFLFLMGILFFGLIVYRTTTIKNHRRHYEDTGMKHLTNGEKDDYFDSVIESDSFYGYYRKPIYNAVSYDDKLPFNFSIYHAKKTEKNSVLLFYFDDRNIDDLTKSIDYGSLVYDKEMYEKNNNLAVIRINVYMDDNKIPTTNYFSSNMKKRIPLGIVGIDESGEKPVYNYLQKKSETDKKPKVATADKITKIELIFEDFTKQSTDGKPISTLFAMFDSKLDLLEDSIDVLNKQEDVLVTDNFSGNIINYDKKDEYQKDNENIYFSSGEVFAKYNSYLVKSMTIYTLIAALITYLYYFLAPTIRYFKNKNRSKVS